MIQEQSENDPGMIREQSEYDPGMTRFGKPWDDTRFSDFTSRVEHGCARTMRLD